MQQPFYRKHPHVLVSVLWLTLGVVVLHGDHPAVSGCSTLLEELSVDGLQSEGVHHSDVDSLGLQDIAGRDGLMEGHSSTDHGHLIAVRLANNLKNRRTQKSKTSKKQQQTTTLYLALSDLKRLVVGVEDGCGWAGGTREGDPLVVGGELHGSLTGDGIRGVEAGSTRYGAEHGKVLQGHLGRSVFTCKGNTTHFKVDSPDSRAIKLM